jgi:hypothetical protein
MLFTELSHCRELNLVTVRVQREPEVVVSYSLPGDPSYNVDSAITTTPDVRSCFFEIRFFSLRVFDPGEAAQ